MRRHLPSSSRTSATSARRIVGGVLTVVVLAALGAPGVGAASAAPGQDDSACAGVSVSATVSVPTLDGGSWSTVGTCVYPEAVYEVDVLGYRLIGGLGAATAPDGCCDRLAFLSIKVGAEQSLTLVGVEDTSTGAVTWAYSEGSYAESGTSRTVGGAAKAITVAAPGAEPTPVADGSFDVVLEGTGTDLATAEGAIPDQLRTYIDQAVALLTAE